MYKSIYILILVSFSINISAKNITEARMDNDRLNKLMLRIDEDVKGQKGLWQLNYKGMTIIVMSDPEADRMRIIIPITDAAKISKKILYRMMQANFDSALDARYCIAKNKVWSAFIHPLADLSEKEFISGLAQTVTLVANYGKSYSSAALIFQGGDSKELNREIYLDILKKGLKI